MKYRRMSFAERQKIIEDYLLDLEDVRPVNKPKLEDFGITQIEVDKIKHRKLIISRLEEKIGIVVIPIALSSYICIPVISDQYFPNASRTSQFLLLLGAIISVILLCLLTVKVLDHLIKTVAKLYVSPRLENKVDAYVGTVTQYEKYQRKLQREKERARREYWLRLDGISFEQEVAHLYKKLGFNAVLNGGSGDGGVDIYLVKNQMQIVVQCKAHKTPVGPHVVRDLHGALINSNADQAILVSVSGFTIGVENYVKNKPIMLVDLDKLLKMQDEVLTMLNA